MSYSKENKKLLTIEKYLNKEYVLSEKKGQHIMSILMALYAISGDRVRALLDKLYPIDWEAMAISNAIEEFTLNPADRLKHQLFSKQMSKKVYQKHVKGIAVEGSRNILTLKDGNIAFKEFSSLLNGESVDYYQSLHRYGNCHKNSIEIAYAMKDDCQVATSFVSVAGIKPKFLHSWVELDGVEVCIDSTKNVMMGKNDYYNLMHINASDVALTSKETITKDFDLINEMTAYNYLLRKEYLVDRDSALEMWNTINCEEQTSEMNINI